MTWITGRGLIIAFCFALALLVANALVSYRATNTLIESNRWVLHTQEVITELENILSQMKDAETGQRGYLVTEDESFLEPYQNASPRIGEYIKRLKEKTADNQLQQSRIPVLEQKISERLNLLRSGIDLYRKDGLSAVRQSGTLLAGKDKMDELRLLIAEMKAEEDRLLKLRTEDARLSGRNTVLTFLIANILALVLFVLVYCLINRYVSERKRADKAMLVAQDKLEILVQERTAELAQSNIELGRSNRELQDFAFVASHDLQEPLRKIQTFGDRLKTKHGERLGEEGTDYLGRMQNAASRMQTLINDLLAFSRVTTKAQPFVAVNLTNIAKEVLNDLEARVQQTAGRVEINSLPTIEADPLQMRQLLQNLIGNSLKFHRSDVPPIVRVSSKSFGDNGTYAQNNSANGHYQIEVADNGIGFDEKYLDRIFTPFQRLHTRSEYEGTGMGLAVCRKIVERHGGIITAESTPGAGTKFIVTLPVKQNQGEIKE